MSKIINKIKNFLIIFIITLVLIEILSLLLTHMKILKFYNIPTYSFDNDNSWILKDKVLGVWHKKNFSYRKNILL